VVDDSVDLQGPDTALVLLGYRDHLSGWVIDYRNLDIVRLLVGLDVVDCRQRWGIGTLIPPFPKCPTFL
jgi:hypothetical protein